MAKRLLYDLQWPEAMDPLSIEMAMCKAGGTVTRKDGSVVGNGLFWHWKRAQEILWPEKKWHRWNELQTKSYLDYRTIVVLGPASSGKTCNAATDVLFDYYLWPSHTSVIICSTTKERLQDRIFGEIKKFHRLAQERYDWLPGHLIEGRLRIVTDDKDEISEGRDFRNGVIGVACFPSGTYVDTLYGQKKIERIQVGDFVINANGVGRVKDTSNRISKDLVRVKMDDGRSIDSTQEHPFFTGRGWVKAIDLKTSDMVFSAYETMLLLRKRHQLSIPKQQILLRVQKRASQNDLRLLRNRVPTDSSENQQIQSEVLYPPMCFPLGIPASGIKTNQKEVQGVRRGNGMSFPKGILLRGMQKQTKVGALFGVRESVHFNPGIPREAQDEVLRNILQAEVQWQSYGEACQDSNQGRIDGSGFIPPSDPSLSSKHESSENKQCYQMARIGSGVSRCQTGCGDRRRYSSDARSSRKRQEKRCNPERTRVVSVEILKQAGDPRFSESEGGYRVYNLEVEGHPSYSVNGVIVHNCKLGNTFVGISEFAGIKNKRVRLVGDELSMLPRAFVDAISNLDKNEDFKCVGLGNPKEVADALGVLAEPSPELGGWDGGIDQSPGTKTWKIRRPEGICVQLVGSDSPNLDGQLGIPLIDQKAIDRDVAFYGKDSLWFTMMNEGKMPRGQGSHRILTRQMCLKFHACEEPIWRDSNIKKLAFMDAGYGGDRCVFGELNWGRPSQSDIGEVVSLGGLADNEPPVNPNKQIIAIVDTVVVPVVNEKGADLPEDQIVRWTLEALEKRGIPLNDFFYEPGQRTKLTTAFNRIAGGIGNPVDCLGKAMERPIALGQDVLCVNYYHNLISQLWYQVRMCVESGQLRGLKESAMWEFGMREWGYVGANKIQVEPKPKMREKTGRSPDESDAIAIGIEGAIERGFEIVKTIFPVESKLTSRRSEVWKSNARIQARKLWHASDLNYSV